MTAAAYIFDRIAAQTMVAGNIRMETEIETLGIDSLDFIQALSDIEDEFHMDVAPSDFRDMKTVGDLVQYVEARAC